MILSDEKLFPSIISKLVFWSALNIYVMHLDLIDLQYILKALEVLLNNFAMKNNDFANVLDLFTI